MPDPDPGGFGSDGAGAILAAAWWGRLFVRVCGPTSLGLAGGSRDGLTYLSDARKHHEFMSDVELVNRPLVEVGSAGSGDFSAVTLISRFNHL